MSKAACMVVAAAVALGGLGCGSSEPQSLGTPAEAQTLLQKAVDHYGKVGRTEAFADFNRKKGGFVDRDLYVFCLSADHTIVANGAFPHLVGTSGDAIRDASGGSLALAMYRAVEGTGEGIITYDWMNPVTRETRPKISFVRQLGEDLCGVGAYDPSTPAAAAGGS